MQGMRTVPGPLGWDEPTLVAERCPVLAGEDIHRLTSSMRAPSPPRPEAHQNTRTRFENRLCWHAVARKRRMNNQECDNPY
jgi:hypothetical protein